MGNVWSYRYRQEQTRQSLWSGSLSLEDNKNSYTVSGLGFFQQPASKPCRSQTRQLVGLTCKTGILRTNIEGQGIKGFEVLQESG